MSPRRHLIATALVGACVSLVQAATDPVDESPPDSPSLVARPRDATPGKIVQSPQGTVIGTVHDVLPEPSSGRPAYLLIDTGSGMTPLPYWAVSHLLRDAHLVIDRTMLAEAPKIPAGGEPPGGDTRWREQADSYWSAFR